VAEGRAGDGDDREVAAFPGAPPMHFVPRSPMTDMGWEVAPTGLVDALEMAHEALPGIPLWVTENGAAVTEPDAQLPDIERIEYLRAHVEAAREAIRRGLRLEGYYVWSLLDNIEWAWGWTKRFGIVKVDPDRLDRRPKTSAHWLRDGLVRRRRQP
jgi:beta-glucosidase